MLRLSRQRRFPLPIILALLFAIAVPGHPLSALAQPATPGATPASYTAAGLVAPGQYISPLSGAEVRWADAWILDPGSDPPLAHYPGGDELHILWSDTELVFIDVYITPAYGATLEEIVTFATSSESLTRLYGPSAEVVLTESTGSTGAIVVRDAGGPMTTWVYDEELYLVDDGSTLIEVRLIAPMPLVDEGLAAAREQVTLNGVPVMTYLSTDRVLDAARSQE